MEKNDKNVPFLSRLEAKACEIQLAGVGHGFSSREQRVRSVLSCRTLYECLAND